MKSGDYDDNSASGIAKGSENDIIDIPYKEVDTNEFVNVFKDAKSTVMEGAWRVDDTHTTKDYEDCKLFVVGNGSTVAVKSDGDIISVCRMKGDIVRGCDLLKVAIKNGGIKLDAFGEFLYKFYTRNGFEPVSWVKFDKNYAPYDWVDGYDNEEEVIFYRYTGRIFEESYKAFLNSTSCSDDYDNAKTVRDDLLRGF